MCHITCNKKLVQSKLYTRLRNTTEKSCMNCFIVSMQKFFFPFTLFPKQKSSEIFFKCTSHIKSKLNYIKSLSMLAIVNIKHRTEC